MEKTLMEGQNSVEIPLLPGANDILESLIHQFGTNLENAIGGDVLTYKGSMRPPIDEMIRDTVEARKTKRRKLVFVLETDGGYVDIVDRIVTAIREHYEAVEFIVPNYAYSAGTVLVMAGDEIYMDYFSVLGPIDPQDVLPDGRLVPALGYVKRYEKLIEKSQEQELTTAELALLVSGFDQGKLYMYEHAKELAKTLLKEWLPKYKFKDWKKTETVKKKVTEQMREDRADEIAEALSDTERWHSHGRGISMKVLENDLKLKIKDFGADPNLNTAVRNYYRLLIDYSRKTGNGFVVHTPGKLVMWGS